MTEDKEKHLVRDFPDLFRNYKKKDSCMFWGLTCDDGWFDLIYRLSSEIDRLAREHGVVVVVEQVKEKLGGLRFYYSVERDRAPQETASEVKVVTRKTPGGFRIVTVPRDSVHDAIHSIVDAAEQKSTRICELCGQPGKCKNTGGRVQTLCAPCYVQRLAEEESR